ncbi:MAG TPA: zf-HC2 domain-containing protein [Bryobacterales bacterium]|jgi:anti-sigma factor RsiW|nr:zf-HC2 domain-containing protein [Bryobacterales bacterium]
MHVLLRDNLEGYLSGNLDSATLGEVESHLAECSGCRQEWIVLRQSAEAIRSLRPPLAMDWDLAPGFYARVMERIDEEREIPFWAMLLDPAFGRKLVFACLMLLALLGTYVAAFEKPDYALQHLPEAVLAGQESSAPAPRIGPSLDRNRGVMLATLVADGD